LVLTLRANSAAACNESNTRMRQIYGDIPYSEAFKGAEGVSAPKYDKQEDVMKGLLAELETASKLFDDQNRDCRLT
jgi:hypothetical protein